MTTGTTFDVECKIAKLQGKGTIFMNITKCIKQTKFHMGYPIAKELIDKIVVSAFYKKDGKQMQDVTIYYNFVGSLTPQKELQDEAV